MASVQSELEVLAELEQRQSSTDAQRRAIETERSQALATLRQRLQTEAEATTGDCLRDLVIVNYRVDSAAYVEQLRQLDQAVAAHPDQFVLLVEQEARQHTHRDPGPAQWEDFGTETWLTLGLLNGKQLVIEPNPNNGEAELPAQLRTTLLRSWVQMDRPWRVGFPTSGFVLETKDRQTPWRRLSQNLFPESDLIGDLNQPIQTGFEDLDRFPRGGLEKIHVYEPGRGPVGLRLQVLIGDDAVEQYFSKNPFSGPLRLWKISQALGRPCRMFERLRFELQHERQHALEELAKQLQELNQLNRNPQLAHLRASIAQLLQHTHDLRAELTPELRQLCLNNNVPLPE